MSGAFAPSSVRLGGLVRKIPWKMNDGRKANVRKRMKEVDSVISALDASGVRIKALVSRSLIVYEYIVNSKEYNHTEQGSYSAERRPTHSSRQIHYVCSFCYWIPKVYPQGIYILPYLHLY